MITFKAKDQYGEIFNSALSPFTFPAGEAHTKREDRRELEETEIAVIQPSASSIHDDLFQLAMWDRAIPLATKRVLILPYIPGARADRGVPLGIGVYANFLNDLHLSQIISFDPHSIISVGALRHHTVVESDELFLQRSVAATLPEYTGIIAPDKGAKLRAGRVADLLELPLYTADKARDFDNGKLLSYSIDVPSDGKYLVVDDICDGGGTFKMLADASKLDKEQLDLFVSHGVFSKNAYFTLSKSYGTVFTTNSYIPEESAPNFFYNRGRKIQEASDFHVLDVIRLLFSHIND